MTYNIVQRFPECVNSHFIHQPMTCNEHHAVKDRFIAHKGLDVTGIGATACARHGCFCPGSVVNFVKGESFVGFFMSYYSKW